MATKTELLALAAEIKNETTLGANTALRVGTMLEELINNSAQPKRYKALISQVGIDAPTVTSNGTGANTPLENTTGNIVWTRADSGISIGTLVGAFPEGKTFLKPISTQYEDYAGLDIYFKFTRLSDDSVQIVSFLDGANTDELLVNAGVEIEVYE